MWVGTPIVERFVPAEREEEGASAPEYASTSES
jgi:hypothetical protein